MIKGINAFCKACDKFGVSKELFCASEARKNTKPETVYIYQTGNRLKAYHRFAIKYFPSEKIFICWNAQIKKRKNFRLKKRKVLECLECNKLIAKKGIEFAWRKQENVYVFDVQEIERFIRFLQMNEGGC